MSFSKGLIACAVIAGIVAAPARAQDDTVVMNPAGDWTADFGEDYCRLVRSFSDGSETITLAFERIQPGPTMRLQIIGDGFRTFRGADRIGYAFKPGGSQSDSLTSSDFVSSQTASGERLTILSFVSLGSRPVFNRVFQRRTNAGDEDFEAPAPFPDYDPAIERTRGAEVRSLHFEEGMARPLKFELGPINEVMNVLQMCTSDLLRSWGLDAERHASRQRGPLPKQGPLIGRSTLPFDQFSRLVGGFNQVRVMVSETGEATSCHIHFPTLDAGVNERICEQVLDNAEFEPALDSQGEALASYWTVPVFVLLGPPPD